MSEIVTLPILYFFLLSVVTISAALVSRKGGKVGILATGAAMWILLTIWSLVSWRGPGPLTFGHLGLIGLFVGLPLTLALAPLYFFGSEGSLKKKMWWSVAGAAVTAPVLLFWIIAFPIPYHYPCELPTLKSDMHFEPLVEVGTSSFFSDSCPVPIDKKFKLRRDWGVVLFEWHTSNLWMKATTSGGPNFLLTGDGVRPNNGTFLGERYTEMKSFGGRQFLDANVISDFVLEVRGSNGELVDSLNMTYDTAECTCAVYDGL